MDVRERLREWYKNISIDVNDDRTLQRRRDTHHTHGIAVDFYVPKYDDYDILLSLPRH